MNREIKFRAKDYQTNKWVYGFLFMGKGDDNRDYAFILQDKGLKVGTATEDNAIEFPCDEAHLVDKETICQYTGLKDKNGKEIYEGDILRGDEYPFNCDGVDNYFAEIVWADNVCGFYRITLKNPNSTVRGISHGNWEQLDEEDIKSFEVIGNIYDDKELVEG